MKKGNKLLRQHYDQLIIQWVISKLLFAWSYFWSYKSKCQWDDWTPSPKKILDKSSLLLECRREFWFLAKVLRGRRGTVYSWEPPAADSRTSTWRDRTVRGSIWFDLNNKMNSTRGQMSSTNLLPSAESNYSRKTDTMKVPNCSRLW